MPVCRVSGRQECLPHVVMFQIKVCGITTPDDALLAAEAGASAIGLNFYEKSPRFITADRAAEIVARLREEYSADQVHVFGVFVNASLDEILWTIRDGDLYGPEKGFGIQLHGDEPPELIRGLHREGLGRSGDLLQVTGHIPEVPIIRAFRCARGDFTPIGDYLESCRQLGSLPQAVLVDAFAPGSYGGTGQCLDWTAIEKGRQHLAGLPPILAGGLTSANVAEAIRSARPDAVDVASGVESAPGKKDAAKVYAFVAAAKKAFAVA
jgi:phosphoribosylanthranilate isomerase